MVRSLLTDAQWEKIAPLLPVMAELLQQASGAAGRIEWLVAER